MPVETSDEGRISALISSKRLARSYLKAGENITLTDLLPTEDAIEVKSTGTLALSRTPNETRDRVLVWYVPGTLAVKTNVSAELRMPVTGNIIRGDLSIKTAPTGSPVIADINISGGGGGKPGTSLWNAAQGSRLRLGAGSTVANRTYFRTGTFPAGAFFNIDVDRVGAGTAGRHLTAMLHVRYA